MRKLITLTVVSTPGVVSLAALAQGFRGFRILDDAPLDRSVAFPRTRLVELYREIEAENIATTRLLEGGEYNLNIRHVENATPENYTTLTHPDTIDARLGRGARPRYLSERASRSRSRTAGRPRQSGAQSLKRHRIRQARGAQHPFGRHLED